jgi:hypothetical protein
VTYHSQNAISETVKFVVEDVRVAPFSKKSLVVYSNFTGCRKGFVVRGVCWWVRGRMDWIDLAKDRDTHVV